MVPISLLELICQVLDLVSLSKFQFFEVSLIFYDINYTTFLRIVHVLERYFSLHSHKIHSVFFTDFPFVFTGLISLPVYRNFSF